jgi:hypothetical protein
MVRLLLSLILSCGLLLLTSCDTADPDPDPQHNLPDADPGEGHAEVSGGITTSFSGEAFWTIFHEGTNEAVFAIGVYRGAIEDVDLGDFEMVAVIGGATPYEVGTHSLLAGNGFYGSHDRAAVSTSGTLTITTSTPERVAGSLTFSGPAGTETQPLGNAFVSANFDAFYIDPADLPQVEEEEDSDVNEQSARLPGLR